MNFLETSPNLVVVILGGKVPDDLRPYFLSATLTALKRPEGGLWSIAMANLEAGCLSKRLVTMFLKRNRRGTKVVELELLLR